MIKTVSQILDEYGIHREEYKDNFVIICPFHADSNPSLGIRIDNGAYNCWSCGAHGNFVNFVKEYENISEDEARKKIYGEGLDLIFSPFKYEDDFEGENIMRKRYYFALKLMELALYKNINFFNLDVRTNEFLWVFDSNLQVPEIDFFINRQKAFYSETEDVIYNKKLAYRRMYFEEIKNNIYSYYEIEKIPSYISIYSNFLLMCREYGLENEMDKILSILDNKKCYNAILTQKTIHYYLQKLEYARKLFKYVYKEILNIQERKKLTNQIRNEWFCLNI